MTAVTTTGQFKHNEKRKENPVNIKIVYSIPIYITMISKHHPTLDLIQTLTAQNYPFPYHSM